MFFELDAQRSNVGVSFLLFSKTCYFCRNLDVLRFHFSEKCYLIKYTVVGCKVYGDVWVHVYAFWVHVYAFWVHVYGSVGCMYAVVGCKVYGDVWVQSI